MTDEKLKKSNDMRRKIVMLDQHYNSINENMMNVENNLFTLFSEFVDIKSYKSKVYEEIIRLKKQFENL